MIKSENFSQKTSGRINFSKKVGKPKLLKTISGHCYNQKATFTQNTNRPKIGIDRENYFRDPNFYNDCNLNTQITILRLIENKNLDDKAEKARYIANTNYNMNNTNLNTNHTSNDFNNTFQGHSMDKSLSKHKKLFTPYSTFEHKENYQESTHEGNEESNNPGEQFKEKPKLKEELSYNELPKIYDNFKSNTTTHKDNNNNSPNQLFGYLSFDMSCRNKSSNKISYGSENEKLNYINQPSLKPQKSCSKILESDEFYYKSVFKGRDIFKPKSKVVVDNKLNLKYAENEEQYKQMIKRENKILMQKGLPIKIKNVSPFINIKLNDAKDRLRFMKGIIDFSYPGFVLKKIKVMTKYLADEKTKSKSNKKEFFSPVG